MWALAAAVVALGARGLGRFTACSFPRQSGVGAPWTRSSNCSQGYLGVPFICDPGALISRTEARVLSELLSPHFVPCHCDEETDIDCDLGLSRYGKARLGIALVPTAALFSRQYAWDPWTFCPERQDLSSDSYGDRVRLFTDTLQQRFCPQADVFLSLLFTWFPTSPSKFPAVLEASLRGRVADVGGGKLNGTLLIADRGRFFPDLLAYAHQLAYAMADTQDDRRRPRTIVTNEHSGAFPAHGIPGWAIALCGSLIGLSLALLLVGNVVTTWLPGRSAPKGPAGHNSIRMAAQRWQGMPDAGPKPAGTFSRGTMMFRQFSRRPPPQANPPSAQGAI